MNNSHNRRSFLRVASTLSVAPAIASPLFAVEPIQRVHDPIFKTSLAAYSLREFFGQSLTLSGFIDYCAKLGLDGTELTQYYFDENVTRQELFQLKRHAHLAGVDISGGAIGNNFSVEPGPELDKQLKHTETWIHNYADLGAPVIRVFAGRPPKGVSEDQAIERVISAMKQACKIAGERGIILAIENHDFTTNVDRLMQIVEGVDSPWFGINLDTGNLNNSESPYDDIKRMAPFAVNAQFKVKIRQASGHVDADFRRIVSILRKAKYSGYLVLEYEEPEPYENIPRFIAALREATKK